MSLGHTRFAVLMLLCIAGSVLAATVAYPIKPIRLIVTYPPGSGADIVARIVGQRVSEILGQQVVIDDRAGAGGNIGTELAARADPDGYTAVMCATALVIGPSLYRKLPYDPIRDFAPVTLLVRLPFLLVINPGIPAHNVRELIAFAQSRPDELRYASIGEGTMQQIAAALFKSMARVNMMHVPYKATGQYVTDLLSGRVSLMFTGMPPVLPHVKSGKLLALAVTTLARSKVLPDVPTVDEAGVPGYEASVWFGVLMPAHTPQTIVSRVNHVLVKALHFPDVVSQLTNQGADEVGNSPTEFAQIMKADMAKYSKVVRQAGIRIE